MYISIAKEHMKSKTSKILGIMEMEQYTYIYIYTILYIYIYLDLGKVWYGMVWCVPPGQLPLQLRPALPKTERETEMGPPISCTPGK